MKKQDAVQLVVTELGKHRSRNELTMSICEKTGMNWDQAENFIKQVESEHGRSIAARQSPLIVLIGIVTIIGGILSFLYGLIYFIGLVTGHVSSIMPKTIYYRAAAMGTGIIMVTGGFIGIGQTIKALFKRD